MSHATSGDDVHMPTASWHVRCAMNNPCPYVVSGGHKQVVHAWCVCPAAAGPCGSRALRQPLSLAMLPHPTCCSCPPEFDIAAYGCPCCWDCMQHAGRGVAALSVGCWPASRSSDGTSARLSMCLTFGHNSRPFVLLVHPSVAALRCWVARLLRVLGVCCVCSELWCCLSAVYRSRRLLVWREGGFRESLWRQTAYKTMHVC